MDGLVNSCPLLDYVAEISQPGKFLLVDVGCSGGIDRQWRRMGPRLRALGIDPDVGEIERLRGREKNPRISYLNAFAGIAAEHPFAVKRRGKIDRDRDPWTRLSTPRYMEQVYPKASKVTEKEKRSANLWREAQLADPAAAVVIPEYLRRADIGSVDFLKIDVDGKDFDILNSFDRALSDLQVLGVGIEVRFWGSAEETDGTLHNVDRFLKARGFELFNLSTRRYSTAALPSRFNQRAPGATESGRLHQGDALYARDLGSDLYDEWAWSLDAEKILNLAAIFAIFDLTDCAAEVALKFRTELAKVCDVDQVLDRLTGQVERKLSGRSSYVRYVERFAQRPKTFLGTKNPFPKMTCAWKKGYLKWKGRMELLRIEGRGGEG